MNITESVEMALENFISVSDQVNITESITSLIPFLVISVNDQLNLTESVETSLESFISVSDQLNLTENVSASIFFAPLLFKISIP